MRKWLAAVLAGAALLSAGAASGEDYQRRRIGDWMVSGTSDRFGDGGSYNAVTIDGVWGLAVRCIRRNLSLAAVQTDFSAEPLKVGEIFEIKFKTGDRPIEKTYGEAYASRLILIDATLEQLRAIRDGQETAVRRENTRGDIVGAHVFKTAGAREAFADLAKECPLD